MEFCIKLSSDPAKTTSTVPDARGAGAAVALETPAVASVVTARRPTARRASREESDDERDVLRIMDDLQSRRYGRIVVFFVNVRL
jgi:hypothetical protein